MTRADGRAADELRPITITRNWLDHAAGSVLVEFGKTRVLCAASASVGVPRWRKDSGLGWVTAEYAMLPSSTHTRSDRESVKGRIGGRTHEISRLIGRSLRAVIDYRPSARTPSCSTATCCRPTAAPVRRRSPARTSHWPTPSATCGTKGVLKGEPLRGSVAAVSVGPGRRRGPARPAVRGGCPGRDRHERRDDRRRDVRRGAGHRGGRLPSAAKSSTRCLPWPARAVPI